VIEYAKRQETIFNFGLVLNTIVYLAELAHGKPFTYTKNIL